MIGIFRTNISSVDDKNSVVTAIFSQFRVDACSVDIEDCDRVLRVVSPARLEEAVIIDFVKTLGFTCQILE
ncbi:hypothetical protein [Chitinophaga sp. Cy-1792]|uniref:hypothetical protein n=1 Tax=Chitinophaga sp. Cy-1792 TaxID=2608339 RepID=UPI001422DD72|nr:hypothetical protein [Chitinophaga sp. Cy-1792]NIG57728.1 hypothetical protein [Chitinophaga sp. Cy-1792]